MQDENDFKKYLEENEFDKRFESLKLQLKGKRVLLYCCGGFFRYVTKNYDFSSFNIIGVSDRTFLMTDEGKQIHGYNIIPYEKAFTLELDCILIMTPSYVQIVNQFKCYYKVAEIIPLVEVHQKEPLKDKLKRKFAKWLPKSKKDNRNNVLVLIKQDGQKIYNPEIKNLEVIFYGRDNYVEINEPFFIWKHVKIVCSRNCKFKVGRGSRQTNSNWYLDPGSSVEIGKHVTIAGSDGMIAAGTNLTIQDYCMLSYNIEFRTADGHSIYVVDNEENNKLINTPGDINIGEHVWVGVGTRILKGSSIPNNCIIGANSLVCKSFDKENTIIAGVPARITKENVNWDRMAHVAFPDQKQVYVE